MFTPLRFPERLEPLVQMIEDTPPSEIVKTVFGELRAGRSVDEVMLATGLAATRSSDVPPGHHGGSLHPIAGLHATRNMATRLPGDWSLLPIIQSVALANRHIRQLDCGPFILPHADPLAVDDSVEATLAVLDRCVRSGELHTADRCVLYLLDVLPPMRVLEKLLQVATLKNPLDDHHLLYPTYTWRVAGSFGWEHATVLVRPAVRFVVRPPRPSALERVDGVIEEYGLVGHELRDKTGEDETAAIAALRDRIGGVDHLNEVTHLLARALHEGLSLEGAAEGLSLGASRLFLRSRTREWVEVHANTTANTQRYLIRQPELSAHTKLRTLLVWDAGPDVRMLQRQLGPDVGPDPSRVVSLTRGSQEALLADIEALIMSLPARDSPRPAGGAAVGDDEIDLLVAMAHRYAESGHDPGALFTLLGKIVCRDESTEMHAYKHHQAIYEEFHDTRPSLRGVHLAAAAQGAALTRHRDDSIFEHAAELLNLQS